MAVLHYLAVLQKMLEVTLFEGLCGKALGLGEIGKMRQKAFFSIPYRFIGEFEASQQKEFGACSLIKLTTTRLTLKHGIGQIGFALQR
ncbi:MAG: hypothetical protein AAGE59_28445 [Cyanobacteria bacterium P01_F01_bin.86]